MDSRTLPEDGDSFLYAIIDTVADMVIGGIQMHRNDSAAIRVFTDIAQTPNTVIHKNPQDFELRCLGYIRRDYCIRATDDHEVIISGKQWVAAREPALRLEGTNDA